ncbi:MAG: ECF-type sigma factor [Pseudomonadota bacterium]
MAEAGKLRNSGDVAVSADGESDVMRAPDPEHPLTGEHASDLQTHDFAISDGGASMKSLLADWRGGDEKARNALLELLHNEFSTIASILLRRERQHISLVTSDLVNEAIVKLMQASDVDVADKAHLLALSARVMRHVLVDAARAKGRQKRKGLHITLSTRLDADAPVNQDLLMLESALLRLNAIDPARAQIVELRYFGGLTIDEIALALDVAPVTVKRSWRAARLWLKEAMANDLSAQ